MANKQITISELFRKRKNTRDDVLEVVEINSDSEYNSDEVLGESLDSHRCQPNSEPDSSVCYESTVSTLPDE